LDALTAAGGFAEGADKLHVNLADWVLDGSRIYFPTMEETKELTSLRFLEDGEEACELVNINTAGVDRLMTLPGVGESKAKDIIAYRERNGDYETVDDIMKVPGIKESIFDKIRDLITVGS
jgi:competence protein ComEA